MTKISSNSFQKLNQNEFIDKLEKLKKDLNTGKMWMNERCETQAKDNRLIRFLKSIISTILPFNLYASIKVDRVATSLLDFFKSNQDHFANSENLFRATSLIHALDKKTYNKYHSKLEKLMEDTNKIAFSNPTFFSDLEKQKENLLKAQEELHKLGKEIAEISNTNAENLESPIRNFGYSQPNPKDFKTEKEYTDALKNWINQVPESVRYSVFGYPEPKKSDFSNLEEYKHAYNEWYASLPDHLKYVPIEEELAEALEEWIQNLPDHLKYHR